MLSKIRVVPREASGEGMLKPSKKSKGKGGKKKGRAAKK